MTAKYKIGLQGRYTLTACTALSALAQAQLFVRQGSGSPGTVEVWHGDTQVDLDDLRKGARAEVSDFYNKRRKELRR